MDSSALSGLNAYKNQLNLMQGADNQAPEEGGQVSFSSMLEKAASDASDTMYKSEATQMQSLTGGKVDLTDLVTAVNNAQLTLNTVVAVRDRVINAYQDIIKMSI